MSKYAPLRRHLSISNGDAISLTFGEIEALLGFGLPGSARRHAAWWSNHGGSHAQAEAWLGPGFATERVDLAAERLVFRRHQAEVSVRTAPLTGLSERGQTAVERRAPLIGSATFAGDDEYPREASGRPFRHPAWGALKGTFTLLPGVDLTEPADPDWGSVYED